VTVTLSPAAHPTASGVSLTGTVQPVVTNGTMPPTPPTGTVTFFDGTTALQAGAVPLVAGGLSAATFAQVFGTPDPVMVNYPAPPASELTGDFNGDGAPDLLLYNTNLISSGPTVTGTMDLQVFASIPGSKFVALPVQTLTLPQGLGVAPSGGTVAMLDIDGDGKLDLLDGNLVFHGKGDGTFANPSVLPILASGFNQTNSDPYAVESYAVDVNGDGKLDIVAVNAPPDPGMGTIQYAFTVFRNDGAGTFTSIGSSPLAAPFDGGGYECCVRLDIFGLSFADFNGDGKVDVLSQSNFIPFGQGGEPNNLNVMLNNGDGTFGPVKAVDTSTLDNLGYDATAFADLNGDSKMDLIMGYNSDSGGGYLTVLLGNGDGTFASPHQLLINAGAPVGVFNPPPQLIDLNADGKLDAVFGSGQVALGNGDGTFRLSTSLLQSPFYSYTLLSMNIFPDSAASLVFTNFGNEPTAGTDAVFTPQNSSSANASVALSVGSHSVTAHYSGDSAYAATVSPAVMINVAPAVTTTTVTSSANPSYVGQSVTFTAGVVGLVPGASGTVTFSNGSTTLGTAALSSGSASFAATLTSAGNQIITATYGGDGNDAASSGTVNQAVESPVTVGGGGGSMTLTVTSGDSTSTQVSVTGTSGFNGKVSFSCTGLPMNASCSFSPASVTVSGTTPSKTTLTVSTAAAMMASVQDAGPLRALTVFVCGLPLLGLLTLLPVARGRRLLLCLGFALFVSVTSLTGCGGKSSGGTETPPGNYSFNVIATSGQATSMASYKLMVQ
jgi:hypothetical protein